MGRVPPEPVFVGRTLELEALRALMVGADAVVPGAALIVGEAGIGKTRLVRRLIDDSGVTTATAVTAWGGCSSPAARHLPFGPWMQLLAQIAEGLGPVFVRDTLGRSLPVLASIVPAMASEVDAPRRVTQGQVFEAATRLLLTAAERRLLVVVLEDLHWSDESTQGLLEYLVRAARRHRLLVLATARSDDPAFDGVRPFLTEFAGIPSVTRLALARFNAEEVAEQLAAVTATEITSDQRDRVMALSEGVPFLVEQVVAAQLHNSGTRVATLAKELLGHRISTLPPDERVLVEAAAVALPPADVHVVASVSALDDDAFDAALGNATAAGIVHLDDGQILFRHALLREATVALLPPRRRRRLHARWAQALESTPSSSSRTSAAVAAHWVGAGSPANALVPTLHAAAEAKRVSAVGEHLGLLLEAARLWPLTPDAHRRTRTDLAAILAEAAELTIDAGDLDRAWTLINRARAARRCHGAEPSAWLHLLELRARHEAGAGVPLDDWRSAVARIPSDQPTRQRVIACKILTHALLQAGRHEEAVPLISEGLAAAEALDDPVTQADILISQALAEAALTRHRDALNTMRRAEGLAASAGDLRSRQGTQMAKSVVLWLAGDDTGALDACFQGLRLLGGDRPGPLPGPWAMHAVNAVDLLVDYGRWDEADQWLASVAAVPDLPELTTRWAHELSLRLAVWRGTLTSHQLPGVLPLDETPPDPDTTPIQWELTYLTIAAEAYHAAGDLQAARRAVTPILRVPRVAAAPAFLWPLLLVAARTEADLAWSDSADPETVRRIEAAGAPMQPSNRRDQAFTASVRNDLRTCRGRSSINDSAHVVTQWRDVGRPLPLAWSLQRLGQVAAAHRDDGLARSSIDEALTILRRLGAARLQANLEMTAARAGIRLPRPADQPTTLFDLTMRERDVLRLINDGAGNDEIARTLFISPKTVSTHVSHILAKLDATSRGQAAAIARRSGLLHHMNNT